MPTTMENRLDYSAYLALARRADASSSGLPRLCSKYVESAFEHTALHMSHGFEAMGHLVAIVWLCASPPE